MKTTSILIVFLGFLLTAKAQDTTYIEQGTSFVKLIETREGSSPKAGDIITMRLKKYSSDGFKLFDTDEINSFKGVQTTLKDISDGDILQVFTYLKAGEKAAVQVPVWVADKLEPNSNNSDYYLYEIELLGFSTQKEIKKEQKRTLQKLRVEQADLFDKIAISLAPTYQVVYKKDGLYILKENNYKICRKDRIQSKQKVKVHYVLKLLPSMKELDNSYKRQQSFEFTVDNQEVIKGWDIALRQMKIGDQAIVLIPSWHAYGFSGAGNDIEPNTPLYFEIEVLE